MYEIFKAISKLAVQHPNNTAFVIDSKEITYSQLVLKVSSVIKELDMELKQPCRVLLLGDRDINFFSALLAVWALKCSVVPMKANSSREVINDTVLALKPKALIYLGIKDTLNSSCVVMEGARDAESISGSVYIYPSFATLSQRESYVIKTSGTTGRPKFVPILEGSLNQFLNIACSQLQLRVGEYVTQLFEPTFDLFFFDITTALTSGAALVVIKNQEIWNVLSLCHQYNVTCWFSVPSLARILFDTHKLKSSSLPNFRRIMFCGEPLPKSIAQAWRNSFPKAEVWNLYGPAETTIAVTAFNLDDELQDNKYNYVSIGSPLPEVNYSILLKNGQLSNKGEGELCISGKQVMKNYIVVPGTSTLNPFTRDSHGNKLYLTGDIVSVTNGQIQFLGRKDLQFKYSGCKIQPEEIEARLLEISWVKEVAVIPERTLDNGIISGITAFWSSQADFISDSLESEMKSAVNNTLGFESKGIRLWKLDSLPRLISGKIDRSSLGAMLCTTDMMGNDDAILLIARALNIKVSECVNLEQIYDHPRWDSLGHVALVSYLSEYFKISISPESCTTVSDIVELCKRHSLSEINSTNNQVKNGLYGVFMGYTSITKIDPYSKSLQYRGIPIQELVHTRDFESVSFLLNTGYLPEDREHNLCKSTLIDGFKSTKKKSFDQLHFMTLASELLASTNEINEIFEKKKTNASLWVIGYLLGRLGAKQEMICQGVGYAIAELFNLNHKDKKNVDILNSIMIIFADHGACASTLALRTATSAGACPTAALVAALSTFAGVRHGGALFKVSSRLTSNEVYEVKNSLEQIPDGYGHRVYLSEDPRVQILRELIDSIDNDISDLIHNKIKTENKIISQSTSVYLHANVDLYSAGLLCSIGAKPIISYLIFAIARISGWTAHFYEQSRNNTLVRPRLLYDNTFDQGTR